ncbi:hypothetical protein FB451DRAFT_1056673, partial [Mycena latifolia]
AGGMQYHFQSLLDSKEHQLHQAEILGHRLLPQHKELKERICELQEVDPDELGDEHAGHDVGACYSELSETLLMWDRENTELCSSAFHSRVWCYRFFDIYF